MLLRLKKNSGFNPWLAASLVCLAGKLWAATETNSWSLVSPEGRCAISVSLNSEGELSYQASRTEKVVIPNSPLGLRRNDQDFENSLVFVHAGNAEQRREEYELFTGPQSRVNHLLSYRSLTFRNTNNFSG